MSATATPTGPSAYGALGQYYILNCTNRLLEFEALNYLENWIRTKEVATKTRS
jgi:hypothetical protein